MTQFYLGIDPGVSGGIVALNADGAVVQVHPMPNTDRDVLDVLASFPGGDTRAVIERVGPSPQMGVVSVWTFGRGYGALLMALTAARIPFDQVTPRTWQAAMQCLTGGVKNVSKRRAQQLFPEQRVTHSVADALLLAEYGRRLNRGMVPPQRKVSHGKAQVSSEEVRARAEALGEAVRRDKFPPLGDPDSEAGPKGKRQDVAAPEQQQRAESASPRDGTGPRRHPRQLARTDRRGA